MFQSASFGDFWRFAIVTPLLCLTIRAPGRPRSSRDENRQLPAKRYLIHVWTLRQYRSHSGYSWTMHSQRLSRTLGDSVFLRVKFQRGWRSTHNLTSPRANDQQIDRSQSQWCPVVFRKLREMMQLVVTLTTRKSVLVALVNAVSTLLCRGTYRFGNAYEGLSHRATQGRWATVASAARILPSMEMWFMLLSRLRQKLFAGLQKASCNSRYSLAHLTTMTCW